MVLIVAAKLLKFNGIPEPYTYAATSRNTFPGFVTPNTCTAANKPPKSKDLYPLSLVVIWLATADNISSELTLSKFKSPSVSFAWSPLKSIVFLSSPVPTTYYSIKFKISAQSISLSILFGSISAFNSLQSTDRTCPFSP
jgi:hypothetical protein